MMLSACHNISTLIVKKNNGRASFSKDQRYQKRLGLVAKLLQLSMHCYQRYTVQLNSFLAIAARLRSQYQLNDQLNKQQQNNQPSEEFTDSLNGFDDEFNKIKSHRHRGQYIEELVSQWLIKQSIRILVRNYTIAGGEIDIIGVDNQGWLIFFEVKHRRSTFYGSAASQVTKPKQHRIRKAAMHYLQRQYPNLTPNCRFDVISTETDQLTLTWIKNAF